MNIRKVGFFPELRSIVTSSEKMIPEGINYDKGRMTHYLTAGVIAVAAPGVAFDILQESSDKPIGSRGVKTDGEWIWPSELVFYVNRYNIRLPEEFVLHCIHNDWRVPEGVDVLSIASILMSKTEE